MRMLKAAQCVPNSRLLSRSAGGNLPCNVMCRNLRSGFLRIRAESPIIEEVVGRRINAPVFTRTRWRHHQDTSRYLRHLGSLFRSVTFRNLKVPLSTLALVSCSVVIYRTLLAQRQLPDLFEGVRFTDVPFQLTSFALSLLLVFRTDASYSRWCAALDAWGTIRNSSAQLVRKATAWVDETSALQRLVRWVGAYPVCLTVELRYDNGDPGREAAIREELAKMLRPYEVDQVVASGPYYHQFCLSVLTALVEAAGLGESREATMLEDLSAFNQAASECEKIMRFPIPLTYTRHTSRFMLIYLGALPLALYDWCGWAVVPVTLVISFLLLGIEDIGVQIEEPFSFLPLMDVCADLRHTATRAMAQRSMVRCLANPDACHFDPAELERGELAGRKAAVVLATVGRDGVDDEDDGDDAGGGGGGGMGGGGGGALSSRAGPNGDRGSYAGLVAAVADAGGNGNGNGNGVGHVHGNGHGYFKR